MKEKQNDTHNVKQLPDLSLRFLQILEENNLTGYRLKKDKTAITPSKLTHIKNGRNKVTDDLIDALLNYIPNLSKVWLLTGVGEKYKDNLDKKKAPKENETASVADRIKDKSYDDQMKKLHKEINDLRKEVSDLRATEENHTKAILQAMRNEFTAVFDYFKKENVRKEKENTK
ncbi:hypothetical protein [Chryseobacterium lathyri]|uniref:hypothetical protein n=1 Tax=Chryseobacterium lathyri TaxID=395933 RepID=UPI001CBB6DBF|nr:hypothetical protein [Chryseobacterium lathyri]